jgi:hypothetical protein
MAKQGSDNDSSLARLAARLRELRVPPHAADKHVASIARLRGEELPKRIRRRMRRRELREQKAKKIMRVARRVRTVWKTLQSGTEKVGF